MVEQHPDETEARHPNLDVTGEVQRHGRQWPQRRPLGFEALGPGEIALPDELGEKPFVGAAVDEVAAPRTRNA